MAQTQTETVTCDHTGKEIASTDPRVIVRVELYPGTPEDGPTFEVQTASHDFSSLDAMVKAMPDVASGLRERHEQVVEARAEAVRIAERDAEEERRHEAAEKEQEKRARATARRGSRKR